MTDVDSPGAPFGPTSAPLTKKSNEKSGRQRRKTGRKKREREKGKKGRERGKERKKRNMKNMQTAAGLVGAARRDTQSKPVVIPKVGVGIKTL